VSRPPATNKALLVGVDHQAFPKCGADRSPAQEATEQLGARFEECAPYVLGAKLPRCRQGVEAQVDLCAFAVPECALFRQRITRVGAMFEEL
jgi:hypothetical protein